MYHHLIAPAELARQIQGRHWAVVDCRFNLAAPAAGEAAWQAGHIPGSRYAHLDRDLSSPITPHSGRHPLPDPHQLAATLGQWGIGNGVQVVVYDDCGGAMALRLWWLLRWLGHPQVALLDGGIQAWQAAGGSLEQVAPTLTPQRFTPHPDETAWLTSEAVAAGVAGQLHTLLDARTGERYRGEVEPIDPVGGRIPGALNRPLQLNLTADGCFRSPSQLREEFEALLGDTPAEQVVHYCGSGVTAVHNQFAMELAGLSGSRLYPGSWSEWLRDPSRPLARG